MSTASYPEEGGSWVWKIIWGLVALITIVLIGWIAFGLSLATAVFSMILILLLIGAGKIALGAQFWPVTGLVAGLFLFILVARWLVATDPVEEQRDIELVRAEDRIKNARDLRAADAAILTQREPLWADREKGIVTLPMDEAAEMVIRRFRGQPVVPAGPIAAVAALGTNALGTNAASTNLIESAGAPIPGDPAIAAPAAGVAAVNPELLNFQTNAPSGTTGAGATAGRGTTAGAGTTGN